MELTFDEIKRMNEIQLDMFKRFTEVCSMLHLKYYMIHGSLLGTLRFSGFIPFDDDIDVAMPRKDFDRFINEGQKLLPEYLFLQSCDTENLYPMAFAKIRNSNTAFIQPSLKSFGVNLGIYIDIFPIDNYPECWYQKKWLGFLERIYKARISTRFNYDVKQAIIKTILRALSKCICPSWNKAVLGRAKLYTNVKDGNCVVITGGKAKEKNMPKEWFGDGICLEFEGMKVTCPSMYKDYLAFIYGEYESYNPASEYMCSNGNVVVSAEMISTTRSYKEFVKN